MNNIFLVNGRNFLAESGITLLDAAISAGINLPYSCRTGRCGSCKAMVRQGKTTALVFETGLSSQERETGLILTCVRSAETDLTLEIEDLGDIPFPVPKTLPCRIAELVKLAPDVMRIKLRLPPMSNFTFIPGQYIEVIGANGIRRSYSLANANYSEKILELNVRAVKGGEMSNYWFHQAKPNDLLRLNGPLGTFVLRESSTLDLFFLATGTGIAPVKAILESLECTPAEQQPKSITVLWGGRHPKDFYLDFVPFLSKQNFIPVVSRNIKDWEGAKGYVQNVLLTLPIDFNQSAVYASGSQAMIEDTRRLLSNAGLPDYRFYSDPFVSTGNS